MVFLFCADQKNLILFQHECSYLPYCCPALSSKEDPALARQDHFCWFLRQPSQHVYADTFQEVKRNQVYTQTTLFFFPDLDSRKSCNGVCAYIHLCCLSIFRRPWHLCATRSSRCSETEVKVNLLKRGIICYKANQNEVFRHVGKQIVIIHWDTGSMSVWTEKKNPWWAWGPELNCGV